MVKFCVLLEDNDDYQHQVICPCSHFVNKDNIKFLENIKKGFKRTISWNKYRSEITTQLKNNNLNYMIDPTFRNRLFLLSFIRKW